MWWAQSAPNPTRLKWGKSVKIRASNRPLTPLTVPTVSFSSCQRNLIKTFQIEGMIALITKMTLIFSSDLLNGQK